jgi:serine/threonine protein kinase
MDAESVEIGFSDETAKRIHKLADHIVEDIATLYTLGDELGRGRFSVVQSAVHLKEKARYAVKVVENKSLGDEENLEALETEIDILRKLEHPHIVSLKEVVVSTQDTYIVMELLSGGELFNRIIDTGPFTEADASSLFAQVLLSMDYLHSLNIVHRDVKPENILYLSEGSVEIKLIDFGYAGVWAPDKPLTGLCGTPDYVAPEVLSWYDDDEKGTPYGKGSDLWSLGVLLYVILSGCSPFSADEEDAILSLVAQAKYEFHEAEWQGISAEAKDLISRLLVVEPDQRLTMQQMLDHPWLKEAVASARAKMAASKKRPPQQQHQNGADTAKPATRTSGSGSAGATGGPAPTVSIKPTIDAAGSKKGLMSGCCLVS